jgi:hypothetical protein
VIDPAEEAFQRGHDAVRALVLAKDGLPVFLDLFVGLAVIDDDKIR